MDTDTQVRTEVIIDISDWAEEFLAHRPDLSDRGAAIQSMQALGLSAPQIARIMVAARRMDQAEPTLIAPDKLLLQTGAAADWTKVLQRQMQSKELENGTIIEVRSLVGPVGEEDLDDAWVSVESHEAISRAMRYLLDTVPGHIYNRLKVVAVNGGDVLGAADELKVEIDELVARLI